MKEFVEKLIGRLEEEADEHKKYWKEFGDEDSFGGMNASLKAIEIVNQLAEEYKPQLNDNDLMIVESLPSLYSMKDFEEEALQRVIGYAKPYQKGE